MNYRYYIHVADYMNLKAPKCRLNKPKLKPTVLVTGWNEWLPIISVECEV